MQEEHGKARTSARMSSMNFHGDVRTVDADVCETLVPVCPGVSLLYNTQLYIVPCTRGFRDGSRTYVHISVYASISMAALKKSH